MFKQSTLDRINGWGQILRFVTPALISIGIFLLGGIKEDVKEVRKETKDLAAETVRYNTNHLEHHGEIERQLCERLARIEAKVR